MLKLVWFQATADGAVRLRRNQSLSPRPDRPKSEVGVRWADADSGDYDMPDSPVKLRRHDGRDRPRPKSDFGNTEIIILISNILRVP